MTKQVKLTRNFTEKDFDNGYWYANDLKAFGKELGIANVYKLRKDELEKLIKIFIRTGKIEKSERKNIIKAGKKDLDIGLKTSLPIVNYIHNKKTTNFIITETEKIAPELTIKSGVWYRLNRWRDEQVTNGEQITYGDLVRQFLKLNQSDKFEKIAVTRYINFLSDFSANEEGATRQQAINEWKKLKALDIEKDYISWKQYDENAS